MQNDRPIHEIAQILLAQRGIDAASTRPGESRKREIKKRKDQMEWEKLEESIETGEIDYLPKHDSDYFPNRRK